MAAPRTRLSHQDWQDFVRRAPGDPCEIRVDSSAVPDPERPWLLVLTVALEQPDPRGLPTAGERRVLERFESAVVEKLTESHGARFVGRATQSGKRWLFLYAVRGGAPEKSYAGRACDVAVRLDSEWATYASALLPSVAERLAMRNREQLEALRGGAAADPQRLRHTLEIAKESGRKKATARAKALGFEVDRVDGGLALERVDPLELESLDALTIELAALAEACGGEYAGWELLSE